MQLVSWKRAMQVMPVVRTSSRSCLVSSTTITSASLSTKARFAPNLSIIPERLRISSRDLARDAGLRDEFRTREGKATEAPMRQAKDIIATMKARKGQAGQIPGNARRAHMFQKMAIFICGASC